MSLLLLFQSASGSPPAIIGTSELTATAATTASTGSLTFSGTSALNATAATSAATGALTFSGTSALTATAGTTAATGALTFTGTSALTATAATSEAAAALTFTGQHEASATPATSTAQGSLLFTGTSAVTATPATTSASEGSAPAQENAGPVFVRRSARGKAQPPEKPKAVTGKAGVVARPARSDATGSVIAPISGSSALVQTPGRLVPHFGQVIQPITGTARMHGRHARVTAKAYATRGRADADLLTLILHL